MNSEQSLSQLKGIRGLLVDLDGVVHIGPVAIEGLNDFLEFVAGESIDVIYVTNNSTITIADLQLRLSEFGIETNPASLLTSAQATVEYLQEILPEGSRVYAVGESGLTQGLEEAGFLLKTNNVHAVVVGLDRYVTYEKIQCASRLILDGARFIACNADSGAPTKDGIAPGAGAIVAAIKAVTSVEPVVVGKPQARIFVEGLKKLGIGADECASVGDRLDIDILCAQRADLMGILVLSGLTHRSMLENSEIRPDLVFENLGELAQTWRGVLNG